MERLDPVRRHPADDGRGAGLKREMRTNMLFRGPSPYYPVGQIETEGGRAGPLHGHGRGAAADRPPARTGSRVPGQDLAATPVRVEGGPGDLSPPPMASRSADDSQQLAATSTGTASRFGAPASRARCCRGPDARGARRGGAGRASPARAPRTRSIAARGAPRGRGRSRPCRHHPGAVDQALRLAGADQPFAESGKPPPRSGSSTRPFCWRRLSRPEGLRWAR